MTKFLIPSLCAFLVTAHCPRAFAAVSADDVGAVLGDIGILTPQMDACTRFAHSIKAPAAVATLMLVSAQEKGDYSPICEYLQTPDGKKIPFYQIFLPSQCSKANAPDPEHCNAADTCADLLKHVIAIEAGCKTP